MKSGANATKRCFNSRLREEATEDVKIPPDTRDVSTHASVRRRLAVVNDWADVLSFTSRLREEATSLRSIAKSAVSFNSRLREEATSAAR